MRLRLVAKSCLIAMSLVVSQTMFAISPGWAADGDVRIAGQVVFTVGAGGDKPLVERTESIQTKLNNALAAAKDRSPAAVRIVYFRGMPVITLGGYEVALVDEANAKAAGTTPSLLAAKWANGIKQALSNNQSVNAYIAQLEGNYVSEAPPSAPPVREMPPPRQAMMPPGGQVSLQQPPAPFAPEGLRGPQPLYPNAQAPQAGGTAAVPVPQGPYPNVPTPEAGGTPAVPETQYQQYGGPPPQYGYQQAPPGYGMPMLQGSVMYAPAGLNIPITLTTAISTDAARAGDLVMAQVSQDVPLGGGVIPAGTQVSGQVTDSLPGRFMSRSGLLTISFNKIQLPGGVQIPIQAHLVGDIGKYAEKGEDTIRGEGWGSKFVGVGARTLIGAGAGASLGTAVGAIAAGSGGGAGRGAWSGTAIGAGAGLLEGLVLRKGKNVVLQSGTAMQLQLDSPVTLSSGGPPVQTPYTQMPYQGQY